MRAILGLTQKELKEQFNSPMIYVLTGLFCLLTGWLFFNYLATSRAVEDVTITSSVVMPILGNINFIFLLLVPLITMKSFAEEKKLNTIELLLLSKLSHIQIIAGKFLSSLFTCLFMIMFSLVFPIVLVLSGYQDWGILITGYLGLILSVSCFVAVGIFCSSLTNNQVFSALLTFCILMGITLLVLVANVSYNFMVSQILQYFSVSFHFEGFIKGVIKSYDLIYFITFVTFFLFMTERSLDSRNW